MPAADKDTKLLQGTPSDKNPNRDSVPTQDSSTKKIK
jgi:hypothetical protein